MLLELLVFGLVLVLAGGFAAVLLTALDARAETRRDFAAVHEVLGRLAKTPPAPAIQRPVLARFSPFFGPKRRPVTLTTDDDPDHTRKTVEAPPPVFADLDDAEENTEIFKKPPDSRVSQILPLPSGGSAA